MSKGIPWARSALILGAACCSAAFTAWGAPGEPAVDKRSPYMQALPARPMPAEFFEQLVVKNIYELAGDFTSSQKLQQYIDAEALAKIEGREWKLAPTVKDAIATQVAGITQAQVNAILGGALNTTQSADEAVAQELLPKARNAESRSMAAPGLWRTKVSARSTMLSTFVLLGNATHAKISKIDGTLTFPEESLAPRLPCNPAKASSGIAPGESVPYTCTFYGSDPAKIEPLIAAWSTGTPGNPPWKFDLARLTFENPGVQLTAFSTALYFPASGNARARAISDVHAVSCFERRACVEDIKRRIFDVHPFAYLGGFLFVAALVLGGLIGRFAQKPVRWILRVFLLLLALVLLVAASAVMWASDWWGLVMIVVGLGGSASIAVVIAAMAIGVVIGRATRGHSRPR